LIYGVQGDCLDVAIDAVKNGDEITETKRAEYLTAIQSKSTIAAIIADDKGTPDTNTDTSAEVDESQHLDAVFAMVNESLGIESK
jgi:ethanolamine ammonia-lyase small subunit